MKKRLIAIILTVALVASMVTGCGNKKNSTSESSEADQEVYDNEDVLAEYDSNDEYETEETVTEEAVTEEAAVEEDRVTGGASEYDTKTSTSETTYEESANSYDYDESNEYSGSEEEYSEITESGFLEVAEQPLSTFSADVDTASYSNFRRMVTEGYSLYDIPDDAIRIEEMLNYFSYDYKNPVKGEPFGITSQIGDCPWNEDSKLLVLGLQTKEVDFSETAPSNLVFLLDVSGSMYEEDKLPLLQESFSLLAENLTEKDRVSIVTYAGEDEVLIEGVKGDQTDIIQYALSTLSASGSTAGSAGIQTAYELAEEFFIEGGNNRVILATDGDLNVGLTTESELEQLISDKKDSGVFLSVLGFGTGNIKDNKMETLADKGNGNYSYIDCYSEAKKVLQEELSATLLTVAKDVKFQVEFNPDVVVGYRLIGYENRALANEDFTDDSKDAGEVGAGHSVTVLYEIITVDSQMDSLASNLKYASSHKNSNEDWLTLNVSYKEPDKQTSEILEYPIGDESYTTRPTDDWLFVSAVAQFGMVLRDSEYVDNSSLKSVVTTLKKVDTDNDEYKEEFYNLVKQLYDAD